MEGTLIVQEKRGIIDKFRDWYKTKGISQKIDDKLDERNERLKRQGEIDIRIAHKNNKITVDRGINGPTPSVNLDLGSSELFVILSTKLSDFYHSLEKKVVTGVKQLFEKTFIDNNGDYKEVKIPGELTNDYEQEESKGMRR